MDQRYEYRVVPAPERGIRRRGLRDPGERYAAALEQALAAEAEDGWEYLRTELMPVTERRSWFGRARTVQRAMMIFRRPTAAAARVAAETPPPARAAAEPGATLFSAPGFGGAPRGEPPLAAEPRVRLRPTGEGED